MQDFDFECRCDCDNHPKYPNFLAKSGFFLILPAILFAFNGMFFFMSLSALSALMSVLYHSYHIPIFKIVDVFVAYTLAITGTIVLLKILVERHCTIAVLGLFKVIIIIFINNCACFRRGEKTLLHFHVLLHFLSISALICLCISNRGIF